MNTSTNTNISINELDFDAAYRALASNIEKLQSCNNLSVSCVDKKCVDCNDHNSLSNSLNKFNFSMGQINSLNGITVIAGEYLPHNTIIVSKDIFELIRKSDL